MHSKSGSRGTGHRGWWVTLITLGIAVAASAAEIATGVVFEDANGNGLRDPGERGLRGVRVSNQRDIVTTDREGRWRLPVLDGPETTFFVIKPRGFTPPLSADRLPRFFYTHKPAGSPPLKYAGVPPTGPLPASVDFPLSRQREPEVFQALFFGDTQPRDLREVDYFKHDIVEELIGQTNASFGVTLGDIVFDDLSVMEPHNAAVALIGIPWWNVIGNHDINTDAPDADAFDDTYNRLYGPNYFSFDYGPVHFVALDNIRWVPPAERTSSSTWRPSLDERQLAWLEADLQGVPQRQLVLLMMHVPINDLANREAVYRLIEGRPYCLSIAGHTHWHEHRFLKAEDGWRGARPHHHIVNVTACGSWWGGAPDELGIPQTTMSCGAPNGYTVLTFRDRGVSVDFKAARRPGGYQMNIHTPETVASAATGSTPVYVNLFNGAENSVVEMRLNNRGPWLKLQQVREPDPVFVAQREREGTNAVAPWRLLPKPIPSPHLWKGSLPDGLPPGTHYICVQGRDVNGTLHPAMRAITVE
ncbi:MAG: calcineurin-like phosphoesterase family protein [Verrucomicrobiae bacterium]|nr:calcineurin-like phosphoesterase family protein [Verrucomicrobiae bacterium]